MLFSGCENFKINQSEEERSCEKCHTDYATLQRFSLLMQNLRQVAAVEMLLIMSLMTEFT